MADIGLVLSGGGARGIAHLGVLQALDESGIKPNVISGVSSGALVAALYAAGHKPKELLKLIKAYSRPNLVNIIKTPLGLFSSTGLLHLLKDTIKDNDFAELHTPVHIVATDIVNNRSVSFSSGELFEVITGSAAIPGLSSPVHVGDYHLADGGILNNLPVECIRDKSDKIIAVHVNNFSDDKRTAFSRVELLDKCFHMSIAAQVAKSAEQADLLLEPRICELPMFDLDHADALFKAGHRCTLQHMEQLKQW